MSLEDITFVAALFIAYVSIYPENKGCMELLLVVNGTYDMMCSFSILFLNESNSLYFLSKLHATIFLREEDYGNAVLHRLLAYWLATYGAVRLSSGLVNDDALRVCAVSTYLIEAFAYINEAIVGKVVARKVAFVSFSSIFVAVSLVLCHSTGDFIKNEV